jgi:hypothetical protein
MQCFQKDPNLRVTARKLLRHAWIAGCRRADAPVSKPPANFSEAVEEVKQWNKALQSSETSLRASVGSENNGHPSRLTGGTPAKGPLSLAKQRPGAEAFRTPELDGKPLQQRTELRARPCLNLSLLRCIHASSLELIQCGQNLSTADFLTYRRRQLG